MAKAFSLVSDSLLLGHGFFGALNALADRGHLPHIFVSNQLHCCMPECSYVASIPLRAQHLSMTGV